MLTYLKPGVRPNIDELDISPILSDAVGHDKFYNEDQHFTDTPQRVKKAWKELLYGVYNEPPKFVCFDNKYQNDTVHTISDIKVMSVCAHHLLPVFCKLHVHIVFGEKLLGLSKYSRLAKWVFGRPGVQEDLIEQYADEITRLIQPKGLKIEMEAIHTCMTIRGVEQKDASFKSVTYRGIWSIKEMTSQLFEGLGYCDDGPLVERDMEAK